VTGSCLCVHGSIISTDAMSRGIDVADVDCVVSYDVPRLFTAYIHRVGRTARAGRQGTAFTLLEKREVSSLLRDRLCVFGVVFPTVLKWRLI